MLSIGIRNLLIAAPAVGPLLATYDFGRGLEPAVYLLTGDSGPPSAESPHIVLRETDSQPYNRQGYIGSMQTVLITVHGDKCQSLAEISRLAQAAWQALTRVRVTVDGFAASPLLTTFPQSLEDKDGFPGFTFEARSYLSKEKTNV